MRLIPAVFMSLLAAGPILPQSPQARPAPEERARRLADREGKLQPGDAAPDFRLKLRGSEESVQLSALRGKPVVLYFGSFT